MIIDKLENAGLYRGLNGDLAKALDYLAANDFAAMEPGRYDIDGDIVYALVQRYDTRPRGEGDWEAHRRYIDVQYVVQGIETLGIAPVDSLRETQAYSEEKDVQLLAGSGDYVTARDGTFVIFYPHDAHRPCLAHEHPAPVLKVVVKVLAE